MRRILFISLCGNAHVIIRIMSVDVFGRQLSDQSVSTMPGPRGPPGDGFKRTADGQYDMESKRLCNIGDPMDIDDAVTLSRMQGVVQQEVHLMHNVTSALQNNVNNHTMMIQGIESKFDTYKRSQLTEYQKLQDRGARDLQLIVDLEKQVQALTTVHTSDIQALTQSLEKRLQDEIERALADLKKENRNILRRLNKQHSRIIELEAKNAKGKETGASGGAT